jgi:hypothetical protein
MKSVGAAQRGLRPAQEEVFPPTVDVASQLDALVNALVEASENRVVEASRDLPRERP